MTAVVTCCRSPFDLSLATLAVMCVIIAMKWVENYGDASASTLHSFGAAMTAIRTGQQLLQFCHLPYYWPAYT